MSSFAEYGFFGALLAVGLLMGLAPVIIPLLISPRSRGLKTGETYECGMDTIGSAWVRFGISFYLFALIFVAFEVDVLYLLPVVLVYDDGTYAWRDLVEVSLFVGILSLGILYAWHKGVFRPEAIRLPYTLGANGTETPSPRSES
ncbi:MAG: NAD(P)H-quinone oxidoreductase subunit 3 [Candidatus Sumerlaeota bacterium]|nr:NAD(P)H-quinone oxidoreductase subunit 3 [Candidatus Sumerlaeota bacterium]